MQWLLRQIRSRKKNDHQPRVNLRNRLCFYRLLSSCWQLRIKLKVELSIEVRKCQGRIHGCGRAARLAKWILAPSTCTLTARSLAPLPKECGRMCSQGGVLSIRHKIDLELRTAYYCRLEPMKDAALSCALVSRLFCALLNIF